MMNQAKLILSALLAIYNSPAIAADYQVVFFCGAGGVQYLDCVKDMERIENITRLPVKMFFPSAQRSFPDIRYYDISDFQKHEEWMRNNIRENSNIHYIFVASSQGWIPFNKLSGKLHDIGIRDHNYDVILNQPAGSWATGVAPNKLPHSTFSFDSLEVTPLYVVNLQAPDIATKDRFDEPNIEFSENYFSVRYGPITDLDTMTIVNDYIDKHSIATGVGLANEVPSVINILSRRAESSSNVAKQIRHILSEGASLRQHFYDLSINKAANQSQNHSPKKTNAHGGVSMNIDVKVDNTDSANGVGTIEHLRESAIKSRPSFDALAWPAND